jgi:hypothetical protein
VRSDLARKIDEKPKKYILPKPKVLPLNNLLGYPDFYQCKPDEPEESLSMVSIFLMNAHAADKLIGET